MGRRHVARPQASKRQREARNTHPRSSIVRQAGIEDDPFVRLCPVTRKASFPTEVEANAAVRQAKGSDNPFLTVKRAYRCPDCRLWHLTSLTVQQSDDAMFEQHPELGTAVTAMARSGVVTFAMTKLAEPVLDGSPLCIPWSWAQRLRDRRMVTAAPATPDGFRLLTVTTHGWFCARRLTGQRHQPDRAA